MAIVYPPHAENFFQNLTTVYELVKIHEKVAGTGRGRKSGVEILNKSCVVLLTACWETFIEELLSASFDFLVENASDHKSIPFSVLTRASNDLKNDKDARKVWDLAGDGWKDILRKYRSQILTRELDHFHVPRPDNIDDLFEKMLGITEVTSKWRWKKMNNTKIRTTLNTFVDLRGEIAHKVKSSRKVRKKDVYYYAHFINACGVILHNVTSEYLELRTGKRCWAIFRHKTIQ